MRRLIGRLIQWLARGLTWLRPKPASPSRLSFFPRGSYLAAPAKPVIVPPLRADGHEHAADENAHAPSVLAGWTEVIDPMAVNPVAAIISVGVAECVEPVDSVAADDPGNATTNSVNLAGESPAPSAGGAEPAASVCEETNAASATAERRTEPGNARSADGAAQCAAAPAEETPVPPARRGFRIEKVTPPYEPEPHERPAFAVDPEFRSSPQDRRLDSGYLLCVRPRARREIQEHIAWGERTRHNLVEQGGILLGRAYRDPRDGTTWAEVEIAVPGASARGSAAYVDFNHETWSEMLRRVDNLTEGDTAPPQVLGWYHTHPGELSVFMSGTDRATQRRMFYADWHFAMVLNPQRRVWRVFHGAECVECLGCAVRPERPVVELPRGLIEPPPFGSLEDRP